jgi:hypothetical protein
MKDDKRKQKAKRQIKNKSCGKKMRDKRTKREKKGVQRVRKRSSESF